MKCSPNNLNKFLIAIDALEARGGIEIGNAMKMALSVLKHRRYKIQYLQYFYWHVLRWKSSVKSLRGSCFIWYLRSFCNKHIWIWRRLLPKNPIRNSSHERRTLLLSTRRKLDWWMLHGSIWWISFSYCK